MFDDLLFIWGALFLLPGVKQKPHKNFAGAESFGRGDFFALPLAFSTLVLLLGCSMGLQGKGGDVARRQSSLDLQCSWTT